MIPSADKNISTYMNNFVVFTFEYIYATGKSLKGSRLLIIIDLKMC